MGMWGLLRRLELGPLAKKTGLGVGRPVFSFGCTTWKIYGRGQAPWPR